MKKIDVIERIENNTFYSLDSCWYWLGYVNAKGYGLININRKAKLVHRVNYELLKDKIPTGMLACHSCDNPTCINPNHIFIGTYQDNMKDMATKGRSSNNLGENNPNAIVTSAQVIEMRSLKPTKTYKEISKIYGISQYYAWNLINRKSWKHL